jgi:hypothetical protein
LPTARSAELWDSVNITGLTNSPGIVDTDSKTYALARNDYGAFPVIVDKVEPYLDGYKITAEIGNMSGATLTGAKVKIQWGPYAYGSSKEYPIATEFLPGRYTSVELIAAPAKAADVKLVGISVSFGGLKLGIPMNN